MKLRAVENLFLRFFPVPRVLAPARAGIDISDRLVKCVVVETGNPPAGGGAKIVGHMEKVLPAGVIEAGVIKNRDILQKTLALLAEELSIKRVYASLPEDQAYIFRLSLPPMLRADIRGAVELRLEEYVPLGPQNTIFDYEILSGPASGEAAREIQVTALPKTVVEEYSSVFTASGLTVEAFEIEAAALARAFVYYGESEAVLLVDIGRVHTGFAIVAGGRVMFSSTIHNFGGEAITHNISRALKVSMEEAEKIKITQGLNRSATNKDLFFALIAVLSALKDEINKRYLYWQRDREDRDTFPYPLRRLILCGGQATLGGLVEYLSSNLEIPVEVGDPWINTGYAKTLPPFNRNKSLGYGTALGLALRGVTLFNTHD
ncbi:MAG: pilus assembly protein PilM [Candidatus Vogelbacteria bacterium]|nr:pilus assembly protein PilM [Candidatus Vogelbacteria bacterium]